MSTNGQVAILGAGVMGETLLSGLLRAGRRPEELLITERREERATELRERYGVDVVTNLDAAAKADTLVLVVKPQDMPELLAEIAPAVRAAQTVVSLAAGITTGFIESRLPEGVAVVRVMPNTPAQVGQGMSVWTSTADVDETQRERVRAVLGALGEELWVEEEKYVDMATALSGTGPTYVFLMMEALIDAGVHMGFPRRIAEQIVLQTVSGSVAFARDSGKHMAELRNMVTSPGGTSAEAIYQMEKGGLRTVLSRAVYAAYQRTQVLAGRERQSDD
jgi:pyrroline-5-carboxylate reductase